MHDEYIIIVDENGQPYIAHAFGDGFRRVKAKYIDKVKTKSGKIRYIYPDDIKKTARKVGNRVKKTFDKYDGGISEAVRYAKANKSSKISGQQKQAYKTAYESTSLGKLSKRLKNASKRVKDTIAKYSKTSVYEIEGRDSNGDYVHIRKESKGPFGIFKNEKTITTKSIENKNKESRDSSPAVTSKNDVQYDSRGDYAVQRVNKNAKVSDEYLMDVAFNTNVVDGREINQYSSIADDYQKAERKYIHARSDNKMSAQEKNSLYKDMKKKEADYQKAREELIDKINGNK